MEKIKVGFIGFGNRGSMYGQYAKENENRCEIVALVDRKLELLDYQSEQKTIGEFKKYISKYNFDETNEDLILFLYKKYSVQYDTIPDGVFADGKTKAYKMTYIFNLL